MLKTQAKKKKEAERLKLIRQERHVAASKEEVRLYQVYLKGMPWEIAVTTINEVT